MTKFLVLLSALLVGAAADASTTTVLDPGSGLQYLASWCGGQSIGETAEGFDAVGNPTTVVRVQTSCHGSGRGSPNQYHFACWRVTFAASGVIVGQEFLNGGGWRQGQPSVPCAVTTDASAVYSSQDAAGDVLATLSTSGGRAQLELPDAQPTPDTTSPPAPAALVATPASDAQIDLAWQSSVDAFPGTVTDYVVVRDGVDVAVVAGLSFSDVGLAPSTAYSYAVRAVDDSGNPSADSAPAEATTFDAPPPPPPDDGPPASCGIGPELALLLPLLRALRRPRHTT